MKLEWHPRALADLLDLAAYVAANDAGAAYRLQAEIQRQTEMLAIHPEIGRLGRVTGTRELVITGTPYLVAYRTSADLVTVLRVLHGARRWRKKL